MSVSRKLELEKRLKRLKELEGSTLDPAKKKKYRKQQEDILKTIRGSAKKSA